jgi:8-oxo-dGTP pyrophosphatase MutT (NUDIX family)
LCVQPEGLSCKENLIKECDEEAGIPAVLAHEAVPASAVSYEEIDGETMKRNVLFCYDLELPPDFQPQNKGYFLCIILYTLCDYIISLLMHGCQSSYIWI